MSEMFVPGEKAMAKGEGRYTMALISAAFLLLGLVAMVLLM